MKTPIFAAAFMLPLVLAGAPGGLAAPASDPVPPPRAVPVLPTNTSPNGPPIPAVAPREPSHPPAVLLWPEGAPGSADRRDEPECISWRQEPDIVFPIVSNIHNPSITPFLPPAGEATGCAVVIAPGGGAMFLTIGREGYDLARWLAERGVAAFVLKYRLERDQSTPAGAAQPYKHDVHALADAQRAIRLVRMRAGEWRVRPDRVGIIGFSAGGVVSLLAAAHHDPGAPKAADPIERQSSRPDFFALIYAGTDAVSRNHGWSRETTPPAFLLCANDDPFIDADELARLFVTLRSAGVSAELHLYSRGGHGFGVRNDRPTLAVSRWPARFLEWLGDRGFLE